MITHPFLIFNGNDGSRSGYHKHFGLVFDPKLDFDIHLKGKFSIVNNGIALLRILRYSIPRKPLLSIYKTFLDLVYIMVTSFMTILTTNSSEIP